MYSSVALLINFIFAFPKRVAGDLILGSMDGESEVLGGCYVFVLCNLYDFCSQ